MPWIARDKGERNLYRLFGTAKPIKAKFVNYDGEVTEYFTWTGLNPAYVNGTKCDYLHKTKDDFTYKPLSNTENTWINEDDSPIYLEPGEGPIEVNLVLKEAPRQRLFEGEGI